MKSSLLRAATLAGALLPFPALAAGHDGGWSVTITTTVGACEKAMALAVAVKDGRIVPSPEQPSQLVGAVEGKGDMWARLTSGQDVYRLQGHFGGASGKGAWSSGTRMCGGTWTATRG